MSGYGSCKRLGVHSQSVSGSVLAGFVIGGAVLGIACDPRWADAVAAAVAAATLGLLGRRPRWRAGFAALALAATSCAWGAAARDRAAAPPLLSWFETVANEGGRLAAPVLASGVIAADAVRVADGVRLAIDVDRVRDARAWRRAPGRVQAHVAGSLALDRVADWTAGRSITVPITLRRPHLLQNFGGPSRRLQILRRPAALTGAIKSAALVEISPGGWPDEAAAYVRRRVRDASTRFIAPRDPQAAAIVTAILIGDRAGLSEDLERRLQEAGTYHVIAISGGNVALLTVLCAAALRLLVRSPRIVAGGTLACVLAYGWIVGGDPSVARAVTAASLYLSMSLMGLRPSALVVLRTAAVILVIANPLTVIDAGAWLSFGATLGIVLYAATWTRLLSAERLAPPLHWLMLLTSATLAAEVMLLPVMAVVFDRVSIAGILLNLVAIPAMAVVQLAGLVTVVAADVWPAATSAAAVLAGEAARLLVASSALVDVWPWLSWRVPPTSLWWVGAYYAAILVATLASGRRRRCCAALAGAVALLVIVTAPGATAAGPRPGRLRITVVDVGQGDAVLVQTPEGRALLVDTGGTPGPFDIGGRVVTPAVWALGTRRLDWLALTHADRDHMGGAVTVLRDLAAHELWEGVPVPPDPERARLWEAARRRRVPWRTVHAGARVELGNVVVEALHPPPPTWERQKVRNDDSVVLRVRYGVVDVWLTGDAGPEFEHRLPPDADAARVRVLKVGHHGSRSSTSAALLDALRPQVAIVSAGRANLFGHPSPDVLARLRAAGAAVFRTDRDGATTVETDGVSLRVRTATGRSWSVAAPGS